ncbi:MAG: non-canonical purine NTP pyrophosphatase [Acidobacteriaceae bacterium]
MTLYAATSNPGKLSEFATSASTQGITVLALPGLKDMPEPVEDAPTFQGNADRKAIAYSLLAPNLLVFADDSGLEVPALQNQPGVRSARFADDYAATHPDLSTRPRESVANRGGSGETPVFLGSKDHRNNALLLHLMQHEPNRAARFVCNLSLARNGEVLLRAQGIAAGQLVTAPRGNDGFGYDPLFLIPSLNLTFAELPREEKWELSHRGNAFRSLLTQLPSLVF